ncbi:MAG: hypothetical protein WCD76_04850, partial [Pyrinomonadaceae bacterium]
GFELYRTGGEAEADADERCALVADMIAAGKFTEAYAVWSDGHRVNVDRDSTTERASQAGIFNGDFESPSGRDETGFDWRFARAQGSPQSPVNFSLDSTRPHGGARSLLLDFDGSPDINARLVSQLLPVEPGARYRLSFAARTESLVSGGMPQVVLMNAAGDRALAQSEALPRDAGEWRVYTVEFIAPEGGMLVAVKRLPCPQPTCPIFGRAWFDDFSLEQLSNRK